MSEPTEEGPVGVLPRDHFTNKKHSQWQPFCVIFPKRTLPKGSRLRRHVPRGRLLQSTLSFSTSSKNEPFCFFGVFFFHFCGVFSVFMCFVILCVLFVFVCLSFIFCVPCCWVFFCFVLFCCFSIFLCLKVFCFVFVLCVFLCFFFF